MKTKWKLVNLKYPIQSVVMYGMVKKKTLHILNILQLFPNVNLYYYVKQSLLFTLGGLIKEAWTYYLIGGPPNKMYHKLLWFIISLAENLEISLILEAKRHNIF